MFTFVIFFARSKGSITLDYERAAKLYIDALFLFLLNMTAGK